MKYLWAIHGASLTFILLFVQQRLRKQGRGEATSEYKKKLYAEFVISSTLHHENIVDTMDLIPDEVG